LDFSNNLVEKFPELPSSIEFINYSNNKIKRNTMPQLFNNAIPCDHPEQNCLPFELAKWKLLHNNIRDTLFEILALKFTINTEHGWGMGNENREIIFKKEEGKLISSNEHIYKSLGIFNNEPVYEDIENNQSIDIGELVVFLKKLYHRKMKFEFHIGDSIKTIDLRTKRNGDPPCFSSCEDCSWSVYKYEIFTTRDIVNLIYGTQSFYDGTICANSWSNATTNISHPERIGSILNLLYIYKLEELVQKKKFEKYGELNSILEWERNYK